ncbi:fatty acyl-CoA hydrolase precursor, medium chain-like [Protopterus annectens]|uniref:fatty acyl-CoA hydrolase precursor, medium chain-like n=1 Tax=Protopterus annectens TaxID=7888 RepID=UPI001CFB82A0|nr:fatty acyl-CoA hydrolase precursor, medium chain-like [Protopterus annectens]
MKLSLLFLLVCICEGIDGRKDHPIVTTKYGQIKGKRLEVRGIENDIYAYLSIPFAKPPVGPLRFSPPQQPEPWNGVRDASNSHPPMCIQDKNNLGALFKQIKIAMPPLGLAEDCLYLNVYSPVAPSETASLPVMVFIHGGALMAGGAFLTDGSPLAAYGNVVIVIIQYRLGILGFFSTGDEHARGNWGFLDQVAALQWVQENIRSFGGDPESVTIFGESAGGFSVSMQLLSPLSKDLFHKAISESGTAFLPGLFNINPQPIAKIIANASNCDTLTSASMVECMRMRTEEEILNATFAVQHVGVPVVVDGIFLTKTPEEVLLARDFSDVPYLLGVNNHEGGWTIPFMMLPPGWQDGLDRTTVNYLTEYFSMTEGAGKELAPLIQEEYYKDIEDPIMLRNLFLELIGDTFMVVPTVRIANHHRDAGNPVYLYEFQHRPIFYGDSKPDFVKSDHGDELWFVWGSAFSTTEISLHENTTEAEKTLSKTVMKYWTNFAYTGSPNGKGLLEWPVYDSKEEYMELDLKQHIASHYRENRVTFWTKTIPEQLKKLAEQSNEHTEL